MKIKSFSNNIHDRKFKVKFDGTESTQRSSNIVIPEGSIIGPLLFIIFINDTCELNISLKMVLFAYDMTIYYSANKLSEVISVLKTDMNIYTERLQHNELLVNWS